MSGSLFSVAFTILVGVAFLVLTGLGAVWILPFLLIGVVLLFANPLVRGIKDSRLGGAGPTGVPTTTDASYDPQVKP